MGSLTKQMIANEEHIKQMIVRNHRAGKCDAEGNPFPKYKTGCGHLHCGLVPFGKVKIRTWPRDENGNLIGD